MCADNRRGRGRAVSPAVRRENLAGEAQYWKGTLRVPCPQDYGVAAMVPESTPVRAVEIELGRQVQTTAFSIYIDGFPCFFRPDFWAFASASGFDALLSKEKNIRSGNYWCFLF